MLAVVITPREAVNGPECYWLLPLVRSVRSLAPHAKVHKAPVYIIGWWLVIYIPHTKNREPRTANRLQPGAFWAVYGFPWRYDHSSHRLLYSLCMSTWRIL